MAKTRRFKTYAERVEDQNASEGMLTDEAGLHFAALLTREDFSALFGEPANRDSWEFHNRRCTMSVEFDHGVEPPHWKVSAYGKRQDLRRFRHCVLRLWAKP